MTRPAAADDGRTPPHLKPAEAWALTCAITPRGRVRVAAVDPATGSYRNQYPTTASIGSRPKPGRPWAVHLADSDGRFRLIGFDLDANGPVGADLDRLRGWLLAADLPHVVCASGPGGGRHVWLALSEPVAGALVARMARSLHNLLPSLDTAPLLNATAGCLRPPGAPHRIQGGSSTVLYGDLAVLTCPSITAAQLTAWVDSLAAAPEDGRGPRPSRGDVPLPVDQHGRPYLPGQRRPLSTRIQQLLQTPWRSGQDASQATAAILAGAARAHWTYEHVAALMRHAPGLESLRTERAPHDPHGSRPRVPRTPRDRRSRATAEWKRAVEYVAATAPNEGDDETFLDRCGQVVDAVAAVQRRADASPGRWAQRGGASDRRVLDQLCRLVLTAVSLDVEADTRRIAMATAVGRETVRTALQRLAQDQWITRGIAAAGVHGAHWQLPTAPAGLSTTRMEVSRSQGATRPPDTHPGPRERRRSLLSHLDHRCSLVAHDVHTSSSGLPASAGLVHQALREIYGTTILELAELTAHQPHHLRQILDRLSCLGLAEQDPHGRWHRPEHDRRDRAAELLGCVGVTTDRAERYAIERQAWSWWRAELSWNGATKAVRRRTPGIDQLPLPLDGRFGQRGGFGPHPRRPTGRADFAAAIAEVRASRRQGPAAA